jgi:hypothetical protein
VEAPTEITIVLFSGVKNMSKPLNNNNRGLSPFARAFVMCTAGASMTGHKPATGTQPKTRSLEELYGAHAELLGKEATVEHLNMVEVANA